MSATRISPRDHQRLQRLARQTGQSQQEVISRALEAYERECILDALNASFAELRADPRAWADELAERAEWDTISDEFGREG